MSDKIKLIALDLDKTALTNEEILHPDNIVAIKRIHQQYPEIKVVIVTGRPPTVTTKFAETLQIDQHAGYMICYNGGIILNIANNQMIIEQETLFTIADVKVILDFLSDQKPVVKGIKGHQYNHKYYQTLLDIEQVVANTKQEDVEKPFLRKISLFFEENKAIDQFVKIFQTTLPQFPFCLSSTGIEIMPTNVNKAEALKFLCQKWDIKPEEVMACGDGMNDIEMLQFAGYSVAVENASEGVKACAKYLTDTNDNGGVAKAIKEHIFAKQVTAELTNLETALAEYETVTHQAVDQVVNLQHFTSIQTETEQLSFNN